MAARSAWTQTVLDRPARTGLVWRIVEMARALDRLYRERRYLAEMDEHLLRDIGLTRADVEQERRRPIPWASLLTGRGGAI